jgi:CRISPR-associated protein Cas1
MYEMRFPGEDVSALAMQQLRGREGTRVRRLYRHHSERTGVAWSKRAYRPGDAFATGDDVNRLLSAANSCLYGLCHAAIVGVGASPGLGFIHTGSAISFVLDIADLYKAEFTIPLAFDLAAAGRTNERDMRLAFRDQLVDGRLLHRAIDDVRSLLGGAPRGEVEEEDQIALWDDGGFEVPGGVNWGEDAEDLFDDRGHAVVSGPDLDDSQPPIE